MFVHVSSQQSSIIYSQLMSLYPVLEFKMVERIAQLEGF